LQERVERQVVTSVFSSRLIDLFFLLSGTSKSPLFCGQRLKYDAFFFLLIKHDSEILKEHGRIFVPPPPPPPPAGLILSLRPVIYHTCFGTPPPNRQPLRFLRPTNSRDSPRFFTIPGRARRILPPPTALYDMLGTFFTFPPILNVDPFFSPLKLSLRTPVFFFFFAEDSPPSYGPSIFPSWVLSVFLWKAFEFLAHFIASFLLFF